MILCNITIYCGGHALLSFSCFFVWAYLEEKCYLEPPSYKGACHNTRINGATTFGQNLASPDVPSEGGMPRITMGSHAGGAYDLVVLVL